MKIVFITLLMCFLTFSVFAQNQNLRKAIKHDQNFSIENTADDFQEPPVLPTKPFKPIVSNTKAINKINFSSSANIYTALVPESNCLTYNDELGLIMHIARAGGSYGNSSNDVKLSMTADMGSSWDYIINSHATQLNRYPSGAILNTRGNTTINNAFGVFSGPSHLGSGWSHNYFGSAQMDSTNLHLVYEANNSGTDAAQEFARYGFTATDSGEVYVMGYKFVGDTNYRLVLNHGVLDADTISWDRTILNPVLLNTPGNGNDYASGEGTAWNEEGDVGYVYIMGVDSLDPNKQTAPVVFKTTNYGNTWTKLPIYDFTQETELMTHLNAWWQTTLGYAGNPRINFAQWTTGHDACVDGNDNLHIFTSIKCGFGTTFAPDSFTYVYANEPDYLYDIATTASGWEVKLIDTLMTSYVPSDNSGFGSGVNAIGWNHRPQISRTADGSKLFFVWTDTDTLYLSGQDYINLLPDIYAYAYDINTGLFTDVTNFTRLTSYDGDNYFMYVSDRVVENGSEYIIPIATILKGTTPGDPITHQFVTGISFMENQFTTSIQENDNFSSISNVYPNPFSNTTNINVDLLNNSNVSINISNIIGQTVKSISYGSLSKGSHKLQINAENLESGIYIYTLYINDSAVSGKMIIE